MVFIEEDSKDVKIGGVYSADGHIVVQEGRGNGRDTHNGHGIFDPFIHHHHHHKKQPNYRRGGHECGSGNTRPVGKYCDPQRWSEKRVDPRIVQNLRRHQELIPRAKLRQRSPDNRSIPLPERQLRHTASYCASKPLRPNKTEIERTRSDTGHYARPVIVGDKKKVQNGFCTLKRGDKKEKKIMDSDSDTSQETVKATKVLEESNESGFDERRDSYSSQEQLERAKPVIVEEEIKIPLPPPIPNNNYETETLTLVSHKELSKQELKREVMKFVTRNSHNNKMYDSAQNLASEQTFVEEEYSYEPELKKSSSKLVLRTRSLLNLEEENINNTYVVRPTAVRTKITTGPDGTFVIDGRKATSELNLSETQDKNGKYGEDLKKIKEAIFKKKDIIKPNINKYNEEINQNNTESTKEKAINNLKKYLKDNKIGLRELLTNKNVVIIEPYREDKPTDASEYNHRNANFERAENVKIEESNTLPRAAKPHQPNIQRHYFYHFIKAKGDLKEEELPDPDKVRSTREKFQKEMKFKPNDKEIMLPIAAKIVNPSNCNPKPRVTPEVRVVYDIKNMKTKKKWTDTGSLSSGISSDMSCFEDHIEEKGYISDDEMEPEIKNEVHPVSAEVMNKIRACGTTVTYYGGRVIAHTHGPVRSPMTMTIMDEIRQGRKGPRDLGKFRLVKSNSCGSRLELAGTDEELSRNRFYEDVYGKSLSEELAECKNRMEPIEDREEKECEQTIVQVKSILKNKIVEQKQPEKNHGQQSWRALIESRKILKAMELRRNSPDMVFEEYQVAGN